MKPFGVLLVAFLSLDLTSALLMDSEHNYIDGSKAKEVEGSHNKSVKLKPKVAKRRLDQCYKPSLAESLVGNVCPKDVESLVPLTTTAFALVTNGSTPSSKELNSTELPSFSEWSQKALEEEERRKSEERKRKEELKRQQQLQQIEQKEEEQLRKSPEPDLPYVPPPPNLKTSEEPEPRDNSKEVDDKGSSQEQGSSQSKASESAHASSKGPAEKMSKSSLETGGSSQNQILLKNFASLDCGAKVVSSSSAAKGASNVLSTSKDEYLLSPCSDSTWFVVELCESMQPLRLEVANFELYSGVPHHLRLSLSHNGQQWTEIGQFYAKDEKGEQSFPIKKTSGDTRVFGKLAKLEILDNHGAEHYCPISSFRLFGIAEIELIGEDGDDDDDDEVVDAPQEEQNLVDNNSKDETKEEDKSESKNIVTLLKEKVDETLERVVGIFTRRSSRQSAEAFRAYMNQTSLVGRSLSREIVCPHCTEAQYNDVYFTLATNYTQLLQVNTLIKEQWVRCVCPNLYGIQVNDSLLSSTCDDRNRMAAFYQTLFGSSRSLALCNVLAWEQGLLSVAQSPMLNDAMKSDDTTYENRTKTKDEREKNVNNGESVKKDGRDEQQSEAGLARTSTSESLEVTQIPPLLAPDSSSGSSGVTQQQSVWQKLSTKIKTLERNLTLSTGYLQKLSLSYKQQIEDLQRAVRTGVESLDALQKRHDDAKSESSKIRRELEQLTLTVKNINGNLETTTIWTLGIHLTCLFLEVIIGLFFVYGCCFRPRDRQYYPPSYITNSVGNGVPLRPGGARRQYTQLNGSLRSEQVQRQEVEIVDNASVKAETTETEEQGDSDDNGVELVTMKDQKLNDDILYPTEDKQIITEDVVHQEDEDDVRAVSVDGEGERVLLEQNEDNNQSDVLGSASSKGASSTSNEEVPRTDEDDFDNYENEDNENDYQKDEDGFEGDEDDDLMDMPSQSRVVSTSSTNDSEYSLVRRHHRSKSSSPCRIAQAALTKHVLRNFNPDQAQWMPPKQG